MDKSTIQLHPSWLEHLKEEFQKDYMIILKKKLLELKNKKLFVICALVIFLSKESAIIYAAGLGFYAFLFAPGMRWVGCGVV